MKKAIVLVIAVLVTTFLLFEVTVDFRFGLPRSEMRFDEARERQYGSCVEEADRRVHAETFARIDNPDVQREILYRRMQEEKAACRSRFPRREVEVELPFEFNLIDLAWRW